mmetsp:Transcript_78474/g.202083  ORF Transcript_78474/g.202083 Transcript_78474/m.202083 type:complete len:1723 (+) Transcript_78474:46-5214(+)
MSLAIFDLDGKLRDVQGQIWDRVNGYRHWKEELEKTEGGMVKFSEGYKVFGFNKAEGGYTYREWLPNAKNVWLIGEFNGWENTWPLTNEGFGRWVLTIKEKDIQHRQQLKVRLETHDGQWHDRVPAWTHLAWQDKNTNLFNGVFWNPPTEEKYVFKHPRPSRPENIKIYEAHVGMASFDPKVATYTEFARDVLPRIKRLGYTGVQLMAVAEHAHYGCFGYHVTSFFAPASRSGTPEELKLLVDTAHGLGLHMLVDLVHAHASSNTLDGIAQMDGTDHCYTHGGPKGHHSEWDSKIFHYTKHEVMRFLLSNVRWWLEEYGFDGFRFDGITSMLYQSHGIGKGYTGGYHEYFGGDADIDSHIYLMLANDLIHNIVPSAVTVGEDVSGMPTLCRPVEDGGFGFDYRLAMAIPDMFIKMLKEQTDEGWDMGNIVHTLTNRRYKEKVIGYVESHDQAIVGDKTIAFWLMDAEMYTGMSLIQSPTASMCVDRGLSLHKMLRLLVLGLGGEGYLNFMGNEFGHPEWIDFPTEANGWSHHHCRRRWDLAEDDLLRYKFFQAFDELMQACENRFTWLESDYQYVSVKDQGDKVIAFDRGDLLFVFNFHPCQSFEGYGVGTKWGEPMRCVLDTDEGRFGGHHRLDYGHSNAFPAGGGSHSRPHSVKLYLPSRTAQVLVPERLLEGGVKVWMGERFLLGHGLKSEQITLKLEVDKQGTKSTMDFKFKDNCVHIGHNFCCNFTLFGPTGEQLNCLSSPDGVFRVYFPGDYTIEGLGYMRVGSKAKNAAEDVEVKKGTDAAPKASKGQATPAIKAPPAPKAETVKAPEPAAPKEAAAPYQPERPAEAPKQAPEPHKAYHGTHAAPPAKPDPVIEVSKEQGPTRTSVDMARAYSGSHLISMEALDAFDAAEKEGTAPTMEDRRTGYEAAVSGLGESLAAFANSYKTFGMQPAGAGAATFKEWVPNAKKVFLTGDFNSWDRNATPLTETKGIPGVWSGNVPKIAKGSKYKLYIEPAEGEPYWSLPAWCTRYVLTEETKLLDALYWPLEGPSPKPMSVPSEGDERIYECHPGLAARGEKPAGFASTMTLVLPRLKRDGYSALLLMGVPECKEFASMGTQPVSLFAPSRDLGTPEELKALVSKAHDMGIRVYMSIAQNGAASCEDGLGGQFFIDGVNGFHKMTGARLFDYTQKEVCRYLLSSIAYWSEQYGFDGFRFQDITSTIYTDNGMFVPKEKAELEEYISHEKHINTAGVQYLMMASKLLTDVNKAATAIADEYTLYPGVCEPVTKGGLGFHMRQYSEAPEKFLTNIMGKRDEDWSVSEMVEMLTKSKTALPNEKTLGYLECADNAVVGCRPLKIAMLSWESLHTIAAGGVAPHVTELAAALQRRGHEVHVFTRLGHGQVLHENIFGVHYHRVHSVPSDDFVDSMEKMCNSMAWSFGETAAMIGNFDIAHAHDWMATKAMVQCKNSHGTKCVFTFHSTESGRSGGNGCGDGRVSAVEGEAAFVADRVIAVSGRLADEVRGLYSLPESKVWNIPNGIQCARFDGMLEDPAAVKGQYGIGPLDPVVLFVGRMVGGMKGGDLLTEAVPGILHRHGCAKIIFVGDGDNKMHCDHRAKELGVHGACRFIGARSGVELINLFKVCDCVVVPSRYEPFGLVVLEAWSAGKVVVASDRVGCPVQHGHDGWSVAPEPGSIAWGISQVFDDFERARSMGANGRCKAAFSLSWDAVAETTEKAYQF